MLREIKKQIIEAMPDEWGIKAEDLIVPPEAKMGDLSLVCFDLAKKIGKNPAEAAKDMAAFLCHPESLSADEAGSAKREMEGSFNKKIRDSSFVTLTQNDICVNLI